MQRMARSRRKRRAGFEVRSSIFAALIAGGDAVMKPSNDLRFDPPDASAAKADWPRENARVNFGIN